MNLIFLLLLLGTSSVWGQTSYVPPTKTLKERGTQISFGVDTFTTSSVIDQNGKKVKLSDGESFSRQQGEVNGLFGLTDTFNAGLGVRFRHQTSSFISGTETIDAKATGVESISARFLFAFDPMSRTQLTFDGLFRYRPYTNEDTNTPNPDLTKLALGDEGNEYSLGIGVTHSTLANNHYTLRGGWRRPGTDLSTELFWNAEIALQFRYVTPLAGIDGITSLKNSIYENDPGDRPSWNTGSTGLYNSINREYIAPYVGLNLGFSEIWRIEFKASQVIAGRSTDMGTGFGLTLVRRLDESEAKLVDSQFKTYDLEATVTKISDKKTYVVIDKGLSDDIEKGMKFDFFEFDYVGGNTLVARGVVIKASADKAIVKLTHRFNMARELKEGLVGRASLK